MPFPTNQPPFAASPLEAAGLAGNTNLPLASLDKPPEPKGKDAPDNLKDPAVEAQVRKWTKRIKSARDTQEKDFKRMRENMDFAAGIQWPGQKQIRFSKYVSHLTNRTVNSKVSVLYAKDPRAIFRRRKRLDFQVWDEKLESLGAAVQRATATMMHGMPADVQAMAIVQDYTMGRNFKDMVDRVGRTLEILYQYQVEEQEPTFKVQMKQLVRRTVICGVGYVKVGFERSYEGAELNSQDQGGSFYERAMLAKAKLAKLDKQKLSPDSAEFEELRRLFSSLGHSIAQPGVEGERVNERLVFDFPPPTSIIIDPACRSLKGFVGAHWVVQEYSLPLDYIKAMFEVDMEDNEKEIKEYDPKKGMSEKVDSQTGERDDTKSKMVCLWEVFNKDDHSRFLLVEGYNRYIVAPEPLEPDVHGFWPIRALTFNDIETDGCTKASIFPPSDVDMMRHAQMEWNNSREALRKQRRANAPFYMTGKGWLTEEDLDAIHNKDDNGVVQLQSAIKGEDIGKLLVAFKPAPIDPSVYDVTAYRDDIMFAVGTQEANLGPARANVTATVGSIAEQSRMTMSSSNVDDLDDLLSELAYIGGEMLMREMSALNVKRVVGPGAVWPEANREDYLNAIYLETVAASSGRPNKAMDIANMRELGPLLMQLGANPMWLVREMVKRLDDRMDPEEAFPLVPPDGVSPASKPQRRPPTPMQTPRPGQGQSGQPGPSAQPMLGPGPAGPQQEAPAVPGN